MMRGDQANPKIPSHFALWSCLTGGIALLLLGAQVGALGGVTPMLLAVLLGVTSLVLGIRAFKQGQPRGLCITGIVLGSLSLFVCVCLLLFVLVLVGSFVTGLY